MGRGNTPTPLLRDLLALWQLCPLVVSQKRSDPCSALPMPSGDPGVFSKTDGRGPWRGGGPAPCGRSWWPYACGSRAPWNAGASWADRYEAWGTPPHQISSRLSRPNNSLLKGCGLHGIGQTGRRFVAGKGYKNPSFAQNARFIIDDERRPCQPYFSPRRGNFFLFLSRVPHLVAAGRGSYNLSTGLSTHLYKKYCDVHSHLL